MSKSPIILFVYNRPEHTAKTVESLLNNYSASESDLFIFSDGPKKESDIEKVNEVRNFVKSIEGFNKINIIEQKENLGLARSITTGVTKIVNEYGKVIVLEDDIITSPYFLNYMNDALDLYENDEQVMHVSGYFFPIKNLEKLPKTFFYQPTSCWGWATWKRAWKNFNPDAKDLLSKISTKSDIYRFNIEGSYDSFINQLKGNANGTMRTWAIKWQASVFLSNGLSLHPRESFTNNIGNDGSGMNVGKTNTYSVKINNEYNGLEKIELQESMEARKLMKDFFISVQPSLVRRLLYPVKKKLLSLIKTND